MSEDAEVRLGELLNLAQLPELLLNQLKNGISRLLPE